MRRTHKINARRPGKRAREYLILDFPRLIYCLTNMIMYEDHHHAHTLALLALLSCTELLEKFRLSFSLYGVNEGPPVHERRRRMIIWTIWIHLTCPLLHIFSRTNLTHSLSFLPWKPSHTQTYRLLARFFGKTIFNIPIHNRDFPFYSVLFTQDEFHIDKRSLHYMVI